MLLNQLGDLLDQRIGAHTLFARNRRAPDGRRERPGVVVNANGRGALASFDHYFDLAVFLSLRLQDVRNRSYPIDLIGCRLVNLFVMLGGTKNRAIRWN